MTPSKFTIVFFDFECTQDTDRNGIRKHVTNLTVTQQVCEICCEDAMLSNDYQCNYCRLHRLQWFWNEDWNGVPESCLTKFIDYIDSFNRPVTAICHNFKSYDGHLILQELSKKSSNISLVMSGRKIMYLKYKNVRFIDSLNFITMPLSKFASSFSLPAGVDKLFFPHDFNKACNQNFMSAPFRLEKCTDWRITKADNYENSMSGMPLNIM